MHQTCSQRLDFETVVFSGSELVDCSHFRVLEIMAAVILSSTEDASAVFRTNLVSAERKEPGKKTDIAKKYKALTERLKEERKKLD